MGFALRKAEREKGLSEVHILARACRRLRKKNPKGDFKGWLIAALTERRCFGMFHYYCALVEAELCRLDAEEMRRVRSKQRSASLVVPTDELGVEERVLEDIEHLLGPYWNRLSPRDRIGTLQAMMARRDHLLADP